MPEINFLTVIVFVLCLLVVVKFVSYYITSRSPRYNDWVREQNRLNLLQVVRKVREQEGDYDVYPARRPAKRKLRTNGIARRRVVRR